MDSSKTMDYDVNTEQIKSEQQQQKVEQCVNNTTGTNNNNKESFDHNIKKENEKKIEKRKSKLINKLSSKVKNKITSNTSILNFNIPTNQDAKNHMKEEHGEESWRYKVMHIIHSTKFQSMLMILLLLDVIILFIEMFLLAQYPHCSIIERDGISCCPIITHNDSSSNNDEIRFLAEKEDHSDDDHLVCVDVSLEPFPNNDIICDDHKWNTVHAVEEFLFALTIFILSVFMIELNLSMIALGPFIFFKQFFFTLDYTIITVSIILEVTFHVFSEDIYQSLSGILVLIRIWRFIRIGHGIVEITHEIAQHEYIDLLAYTESLETICQVHNIPLPDFHHHSEDDDNNNSNILSEIQHKHLEKKKRKYESQVQDSLNTNSNNDDKEKKNDN